MRIQSNNKPGDPCLVSVCEWLGHGASTCFLVERKSWAMFSSPKFFMYLLESKGNIRDSEKFFKIMYSSF